jgi:hypothetical protein
MSFEELRASVAKDPAPPATLSGALRGLWYDARGVWDRAHDCAQADPGKDGSWVHAYLHRKEGDQSNAGYWYARARRPMPAADVTLEAEWAAIAQTLLTDGTAGSVR